ncbi:hypothetical protein N0V88_008086 [Collariella sp. IMI 366227]|nr:hypothetical protein N0V88_008086 [Collariella sp. IMI 366227]
MKYRTPTDRLLTDYAAAVAIAKEVLEGPDRRADFQTDHRLQALANGPQDLLETCLATIVAERLDAEEHLAAQTRELEERMQAFEKRVKANGVSEMKDVITELTKKIDDMAASQIQPVTKPSDTAKQAMNEEREEIEVVLAAQLDKIRNTVGVAIGEMSSAVIDKLAERSVTPPKPRKTTFINLLNRLNIRLGTAQPYHIVEFFLNTNHSPVQWQFFLDFNHMGVPGMQYCAMGLMTLGLRDPGVAAGGCFCERFYNPDARQTFCLRVEKLEARPYRAMRFVVKGKEARGSGIGRDCGGLSVQQRQEEARREDARREEAARMLMDVSKERQHGFPPVGTFYPQGTAKKWRFDVTNM